MTSEAEGPLTDTVAPQGRLFIPACGDRLRLTAPWKFRLVLERRNMKFAKELALAAKDDDNWGVWEGDKYRSRLASRPAELPEGTVLECDRIYIRQYNKGRVEEENDYDSVTWKILKPKGKAGKGKLSGRFWVKLPDAYTIEYALDADSLYRDRVKLVDYVHNL